MPSPPAQAAALQAYGLSEQLWGQQPVKIDVKEFVEMIATSFDECMKQEREHEREACAREVERIAWSAPTANGEWALREVAKVAAAQIRARGHPTGETE